MESSLRSFSGPRIKYAPEDSPYESITVDKLTPIIGGAQAALPARQHLGPLAKTIGFERRGGHFGGTQTH